MQLQRVASAAPTAGWQQRERWVILLLLGPSILYLLATWLGYNQPDVAGHVYDYGTKFLVSAGLLNVLAMVDAYEIAAGKKS